MRGLRVLTTLGLGVAGLVAGHAVGYALAFPDVHHRTVALASTGHGYLPSAAWLAVVLGVAAVVTGVAWGRASRSQEASLGKTFRSMAVLQTLGFVLLEVVERLVSSAAPDSLSLKLAVVGVIVQVAVAAALSFVIVGLRRLGATLFGGAVVLPRGLARIIAVGDELAPKSVQFAHRVRGPPAAHAS